MKHPLNKYVATHRLPPGDEQQANSAGTKHHPGLIEAYATIRTVTKSEKIEITASGFS